MTPTPHLAAPSVRTALAPLAALALLLQLAGCATPGALPPSLPLAAPAAAGLAADARTPFPDERWWGFLGDPVLDALIDQALAGQPSLQAAAARLARAGAALQTTQAGQGPQAALSADVNRQRYTEHGLVPPPVAGHVYTSANLQIGASLELDFFGRHQAALQAALGQQQAAAAELQAARVTLAANLARAYVGLARLFDQRQIASQTLAQREALLALTRQRVQAGLDTRVEQRQAEASVPEVRAQIEALDGQITLARHQLALLSGQAPQALAGLKPAPLAALQPALIPERLGADLLGRRADVVAARWRVEAAAQDVAAARSQFYPDINLVGAVGLNALGLDRLFQLGSRNLALGPALRLPLFDGGRLQANLRGRAAEADAAVAAYNAAVLDAAREVADAGATLQSIARQQAQQGQALAAAESAHELALQRYRAGLGSYLGVLSAETGVLAQRGNAAELKSRALDTQVALMRALGGGWRDAAAAQSAAAGTAAPLAAAAAPATAAPITR